MMKMFVTHVQPLGPFLRVFGQLNMEDVEIIRSSIKNALEYLRQTKTNGFEPPHDFGIGSFCLARFPLMPDGTKDYHRARVITGHGDSYVVYFMDFGKEMTIPIENILFLDYKCPLLEFLSTFANQATEYILSGIYCDWQPQQLHEISYQICNQYVDIRTDMEYSNFIFIAIIWLNRNLVDYLVNDKKIGSAITLDKQKETFLQLINKSTKFGKSSNDQISYLNNLVRSNARGLHPVRQLHNAELHYQCQPVLGGFQMQNQYPVRQFRNYNFIGSGIYNPPVQGFLTRNVRMSYGRGEIPINPTTMRPSYLSSKLSPVKSSVATFKSNTLLVGSLYDVYCCFVENGPCVFSVHLKSTEDDLNNMMTDIENIPLENIKDRPSIGMACIARFSEDRQLYRAVIMSIKPTACQVAYVDYGNIEFVAFPDLYEIPTSLLDNKIFAIRFALSGYKELEPIDESLRNTFKDMVLHKLLRLKVMPLEGPPLLQYCELYDGNDNVLELLKIIKNKKLIYEKHQQLLANDLVVIRYVESPRKFFIQVVKNIPAFDQMMDDLFLYCKKSRIELKSFKKGTACAVRFENAWYRAEILEENGSRMKIRHVDFGNVRNVDRTHLCAITPKLVEFPPQAIQCCLKGFENTDTSLSESATIQLEMLAETNDGERRPFKCQIFELQTNGAALVNLIDDTIRPELNLMKKLYKLSMPFNKYVSLEKDGTYNNVSTKTSYSEQQIESNVNDDNEKNYQPPPPQPPPATSDWDAGSNASSETRDNVGNNSNEYQRHQRSNNNNTKSFNNRRDQPYVTFRGKSNIPPRFQKQQENRRVNSSRMNSSYEKPYRNSNSDNYSKPTSRNSRHNDNNDSQQEWNSDNSSDRSTTITTPEEYMPLDYCFTNETLKIPSEEEVIICWWISPYQFYTHHKNRLTEFENMMKKMQIFYKNKPPLKESVNIGTNVIARCRNDQILYRARIIASNESLRKYKVEFLDFGNQTVVDDNEIWSIEKRFTKLPIMANLCSFDNIISNYDLKSITKQVEKYLLSTEATIICEYQRKDNDLYYVDIQVNGESLKTSLVQDGVLCLIEPGLSVDLLIGQQIKATIMNIKDLLNFQVKLVGCDIKLLCSYNDIKFVKSNSHLSAEFKKTYENQICVADVLDVSKEKILMLQPIIPLFTNDQPVRICEYPIIYRSFNVKIVYVQSENILYAQPIVIEEQLNQLLDDMYNHYEENGDVIDKIQIGLICVAKSIEDENWYRARILKSTSNESIEVYYIDYGNTELITNQNNLKYIDDKYCQLSALAIRIFIPIKSIKNDDNDDQQQQTAAAAAAVIDEIKTLTNGYELTLDILECYKHSWITDINSNGYSLLNVLRDKNLIHKKQDIEYVKNLIDIEMMNRESLLPIIIDDNNLEEKPNTNTNNNNNDMCCEIKETITNDIVPSSSSDIQSSEVNNESQDKNNNNNDNNDMIEAYLSHCDNPSRFFLQLTSKYDELRKLQDNLQCVASSLPPLMSYITGASCIALNSVDGIWYRAKIIDNEIMVIQFIDYGNTDVVTDNSYLKEMNEAFGDHIEPFAQYCSLPIAPKGTTDWIDDANLIFTKAYGKICHFNYITKNEKKNFINLKINDENVAEKFILDGIAQNYEIVKTNEMCFVSHINSLTDFYIQMESDTNGLELIADHLSGYRNFPIINEDMIEIGLICAAIFPDDLEWYRAKILSKQTNGIEVLFIDYGNTCITTELREISKDIANLSFLSKKCTLHMPETILCWSDSAEEKFHELSGIGETIFLVKLYEPGPHAIIDLYINDRNICEDLEVLCDQKSKNLIYDLSASMEKEILFSSNDKNNKIDCVLSHIISPQDFYIQLKEDNDKLENLTKSLNTGKFERILKPEKDMICCAIFPDDNSLYRAKILSINSDKNEYEVQFIDYGNISITTDIHELPEDLKLYENYAKNCQLENNSNLNYQTKQSIDIFNTIINTNLNQNYQIEIINKNHDDKMVVKLYSKNENINKIFDNSLKTNKIENNFVAVISHTNSPSDFYIQIDNENKKLDEITEILSSAKNFEKLLHPKINDICCAIFPDDGGFYRAKILTILDDDNSYEVLFIDFGNRSITTDIRELPEILKTYENLAKHCSLENCYFEDSDLDNVNNNQQQIEYFTELTTTTFGEKFHYDIITKNGNEDEDELWIIKLYYKNRCINDEIMNLIVIKQDNDDDDNTERNASSSNNSNTTNIVITNDDTEIWNSTENSMKIVKEMNILENILNRINTENLIDCIITHINSPSDFYIQYKNDLTELEEITEKLFKNSKTYPIIIDPDLDTICAALFPDDGEYYRARIMKKINDTTYKVLYIDYGNIAISNDIRELPNDLLNIEQLSKNCALENLTNLDLFTEIAKENFLKLIKLNETYQCEIIKDIQNQLIIKLYENNENILINNKLINLLNSNTITNDVINDLIDNVNISNQVVDDLIDNINFDKSITLTDNSKNSSIHNISNSNSYTIDDKIHTNDIGEELWNGLERLGFVKNHNQQQRSNSTSNLLLNDSRKDITDDKLSKSSDCIDDEKNKSLINKN